jgi:two-component system, OmpR family, phosphate regulon sensor histidine kinase PhoR
MNKRIITALIILMGISILGIIAVQVVWMNNAVRVKNELFNRSVSEALHQTVNRLEAIHDVRIINGLAFPDSSFRFNRHLTAPVIHQPSGFIKRKITGKKDRTEIEVQVRADSGKMVAYQYINEVSPVLMDSSDDGLKQKVVVFHEDSLKKYESVFSRGKVVLDSMTIALDSAEEFSTGMDKRILVRATNLRILAEKARTEITLLDNPRIDKQKLEQILTEELTVRNIPIAFQYGVFKDSSLLVSSEKPDTLDLLSANFKTNLYPANIFRRNIQLALLFPSRDRFIYKSLGWLLGTSFLFSMIILLAFAASVFLLLKQKKISEMKADFINNMTHEFKTPIATISVASDSILNKKVIGDQEKVEYFAGMIKKENQRMNKQVEDILTIARLEKKEFGFRWEDVDIHEVITEVSDVIRVQVEQRNGRILAVFEATKSIIRADRQHISNVVFNLLDNANKYSPDQPDIAIKTTNQNQGISMVVADRGIGMTRQVQSRIFERFYRQPSGNIHNIKGFGLGLNYVKAVVEAHKGNITVHSEPGHGSTFELFFPCKNGENH